jgi:hypothetical protein
MTLAHPIVAVYIAGFVTGYVLALFLAWAEGTK